MINRINPINQIYPINRIFELIGFSELIESIDMSIFENIDIDIDIDKAILKNIGCLKKNEFSRNQLWQI